MKYPKTSNSREPLLPLVLKDKGRDGCQNLERAVALEGAEGQAVIFKAFGVGTQLLPTYNPAEREQRNKYAELTLPPSNPLLMLLLAQPIHKSEETKCGNFSGTKLNGEG